MLLCTDPLGIDEEVFNSHGGAIALGHADGACGVGPVLRRLFAWEQSLPTGSLLLAMISFASGIGTAAQFKT